MKKRTKAAPRKPAQLATSRARVNASPVPDAIAAICASVEAGLPVVKAAWMHGVHPDALESQARHHAEIGAMLAGARARACAARLAKLDALIDEGKPTTGQCWLIERLDRDVFHLPTMIQSESRVEVSAAPVTSDAVERALAEIKRAERARAEEARRLEGRE